MTPSADQTAAKVGDTIAYSFVVKNTGNITLNSIGVTDAKAGAVTCPSSSLAVGVSETCTATATHTVTQADVDTGSVSNTATAQGTPPGGSATSSSPSTATVPTVTAAPAVTLTKTAVVSPAADQTNVKVGDTVTYSFAVKNTGNVTLTTLTVTDPSDGGAVVCAPPAGGLAPSASVTCAGTTTHMITQADVDSGSRTDSASATGTTASGTTSPSAPSSATVNATAAPAVALTKTAVVSPAADQSNVKGRRHRHLHLRS